MLIKIAAPLRRLALPITGLTILALMLAPALVLWRLPRPQARGLERVLAVSALLQSFPADPGRPVPALWQQRLGPLLARRTWQQQRQLWWQFWGRHGDAGAFLALPAHLVPNPPATALLVDDLVVVAPDLLSRQMLVEQLQVHQRRPRGLEQRCLQRLEGPQGVYWTPVALGAMVGPIAPLLQRYQQGCLSLALEPGGLAWQGETSALVGLVAPAAGTSSSPGPAPLALPEGLLLAIQGGRLDLLLQGLTGRDFIREPLAQRYGIPAEHLVLLGRSPFQLLLRPQERGPFKASLELLIAVGEQRQRWAALMAPLRQALIAQGLEEAPPQLGAGGQALMPNATWQRADGTVVGGWRWRLAAEGGREPELLFFLGPAPQPSAPSLPPLAAGRFQDLRITMRPAQLDRRGLLPQELPAPVRRAGSLQLVAVPGRAESAELSRVTGDLHLER